MSLSRSGAVRLDDLEKQVDAHDAFINKIKGAIWMLVFLNGITGGSILYLIVQGAGR